MLLTVKKIEVRNFMTHRQESVQLPPSGTVLLWGPSGAGKCLTAGTTVWGPGGQPMSIRQFVLGRFDQVLGVVGDRAQTVRVTDWHELGEKPILHVVLEDGTSIHCADSHPIQTPMGCLRADQLQPGYMVGRIDPQEGAQRRWVLVKEIHIKPPMPCYDITVDTPEHLYLADGIVVHNSSLLDSIGFALYGLAATRASSLDELRHELYPDEDFGVRITFGLGEEEIQLFRGVESGKSVVWMVGQDGTMTESPRAVAQQVSELMGGMDSATFFSTYVAQQGEMDALVRMAGGGRRKFVQRMMGITLLDKVTTQINRELVKAGERIKFLDESMPDLGKKELLLQVAQAETEAKKAEKESVSLQEELEAVKVQGEGLAKQLQVLDGQQSRFLQLQPALQAARETRLPALGEKKARLGEDLQKAQSAKTRLEQSGGELAEIKNLEKQAEDLSKAEGFLSSLRQLEEQRNELQKQLPGLEEELRTLLPDSEGTPKGSLELQNARDSLREQIFAWQKTLQETDERIQSLGGDDDCWVCGQTIPDPAALQRDLLQHQRQNAAQIREGEKRLQILEAQLSKTMEVENARQSSKDAEKNYQEALCAAEGADAKRLQEIRAKLQSLAERKAGLQADQALADSLPQLQDSIQKLEQEIERVEGEISRQEQELHGLRYNPDAHQALREEREKARGRYMELRDLLAACREKAQTSKLAAQTAQAAADQYDSIQEDRRNAEKRFGLLKRLESSMKGFKNHLIGQIRPTLQTLTSQHLSSLTDGAMSGVEIDEEYNLQIQDGDSSRRIGMCSGGEQARAAFSLRLALTQLVSKRTDTPVGFMIFDEIFGSQDEEHRRAILESLRYLRGIYPQTFLISHESSLRESELVDVIVDVPDGDSAGRIQVSGR